MNTARHVRPGIKMILIAILVALLAWWLWQSIWGFGGAYTHTRYVPVPPNLTADEPSTMFTIDGIRRRVRLYEVDLTLEELVAFHHDRLPKSGWRIAKEGFVPVSREEAAYCIIAQQRNVTAYISIRQGVETRGAQQVVGSGVIISIDNPDPPYCDYSHIVPTATKDGP